MSSNNNIPTVTAFKSPLYEDKLCIGIYENELTGSKKFVKNYKGGVVVVTPPFTPKEVRFLPKNEFKGKVKYLLPLDELEIEEVEQETTSNDGENVLFKIMLLYSKREIVEAIKLYTEHERNTAGDN